jgi:hypothetical protein
MIFTNIHHKKWQYSLTQATTMLCGTMQQNLMVGWLDMLKKLELNMGVYYPLETKGDQVVHTMFQMMHGSIGIMVGSLPMPMMSV